MFLKIFTIGLNMLKYCILLSAISSQDTFFFYFSYNEPCEDIIMGNETLVHFYLITSVTCISTMTLLIH